MVRNTVQKKFKNIRSFLVRQFTIIMLLFLGFATIPIFGVPLVDNGNGTITDVGNALIWQKCTTNDLTDFTCTTGGTTQYSWLNAINFCNNLNLAGKVWRLPNITELRSIIDHSFGTSPVINTAIFPGTVSQYYWTSSTYRLLASQAWAINFMSGYTSGTTAKSTAYYVRCVASPP